MPISFYWKDIKNENKEISHLFEPLTAFRYEYPEKDSKECSFLLCIISSSTSLCFKHSISSSEVINPTKSFVGTLNYCLELVWNAILNYG